MLGNVGECIEVVTSFNKSLVPADEYLTLFDDPMVTRTGQPVIKVLAF